MTDAELYRRGTATLLAAWARYAAGSDGGAVLRLDGVCAAVFPNNPEHAVYNNALFDRNLGPGRRAAAVEAMEAAYRDAGVGSYAAWVHETDDAMCAELGSRGYRVAETTRAMGMELDDLPGPLPDIALEVPAWEQYVAYLERAGAPPGLLVDADPSAFHAVGACMAGECVATAIAFDHDGDCGIFNMSTLETARRRGLGTALTARHVHDAARRGCSTASLQATGMAERMYAAAGFRDLGRIVEYAPWPGSPTVPARAVTRG